MAELPRVRTMKIALLADYYDGYLRDFDRIHLSDLTSLSFHAHQERLFSDYFGSFISYRNYFRRLGHEAELLVGNYYSLQQKWLDEMGIKLKAEPNTKHDIVGLQIRDYKPDVFFMGSMFDYYPFLRQIRQITPNIFTWISCPYPRDLDFAFVRCVLTSVEQFVNKFRSRGLNSEWLRAAFDPEIYSRLKMDRKSIDVSFVGGLSSNTHRFRAEVLETLIKAGFPLKVWGYREREGWWRQALRLWRGDAISSRHQGEVWGLAMYQTLAESRITLNVHLDIGRAHSVGGNMRLFEATGCGALTITDSAPDARRMFEPNREIVTYRDIAELCEKLRYYLDRPDEGASIARAGQAVCWRRHSYCERITEFTTIINKYAS